MKKQTLAAILLLALCAWARAGTLGVHGPSLHIPQHEQVNDNYGLYYRTDAGQESGVYQNSIGRTSAYLSQQFNIVEGPAGRLDFQIGAVYGYQRKCHTDVTYPKPSHRIEQEWCKGFSRGALTPMAAFNYTSPVAFLGATSRIQFAPGMKEHSSVLHLALEYKFK